MTLNAPLDNVALYSSQPYSSDPEKKPQCWVSPSSRVNELQKRLCSLQPYGETKITSELNGKTLTTTQCQERKKQKWRMNLNERISQERREHSHQSSETYGRSLCRRISFPLAQKGTSRVIGHGRHAHIPLVKEDVKLHEWRHPCE